MEDLLAAAGLSKAWVNRLGDALRDRDPTDEDIVAFDRYREVFKPALEAVVAAIRQVHAGRVTDRQKTIWSTVAKLRRGTIRLARMQDVAGCRIVVASIAEQDAVVGALLSSHADWRLHDRRKNPSSGYRAMHIVAIERGLPVEVQVRTPLQHRWAELSEAWDRRHEGVKYGRGPLSVLDTLAALSQLIQAFEEGRDLLGEYDRVQAMLLEVIEASFPPTE